MRRHLLIALIAMVVGPLALLAALAGKMLHDEEDLVRHRFRELLEQRLDDSRSAVTEVVGELEVELVQALEATAVDREALRAAVDACRATLLELKLHRFSPNGGISGVAIVAESHISIHTWPERAYAAVDIFMCGGADPYLAIPVLRAALEPEQLQLNEQKRGILT